MDIVFMLLPIVFLVASVIYAIHSVKNGASKKKAVITQVVSFAAVCVISMAVPAVASAATSGSTSAAPATTSSQPADSQKGMSMIGIAIADGLASIGGGIAVATAAPAAIGASGENPKNFAKGLIFVALGEGIAIYGLLLAILMLQKV
jgi:V/A-type H+-transporting ATPase subunit K